MPPKDKSKDVGKRIKNPGKIADLPARSLKAKDAAEVKGGSTASVPLKSPRARAL